MQNQPELAAADVENDEFSPATDLANALFQAAHKAEVEEWDTEASDALRSHARALRAAAGLILHAFEDTADEHARIAEVRRAAEAVFAALDTPSTRAARDEVHAPTAFERTPEWIDFCATRAAAQQYLADWNS